MPGSPEQAERLRASALKARTWDMAAWHFFATVTLTPLVVIPAVKAGAKRLFSRLGAGSPALREKALPAAVAIAAIPAVVSPVDNAVTWAFNRVVRGEVKEPYHWTGYWEFLNDAGGHGKGEMK